MKNTGSWDMNYHNIKKGMVLNNTFLIGCWDTKYHNIKKWYNSE